MKKLRKIKAKPSSKRITAKGAKKAASNNANKKIYFVEWWDAHENSGWHSDASVKKFIDTERCICQEVGWILSETKDEIVMGLRRLKYTDESTSTWGILQKIPKAWIRKKFLMRAP